MNELNLSNLLDNTSNIPENRNYWLVRSMGGDYYDDFYQNRYVAIGYDEISLKEVKFAHSFGVDASPKLKEIFASKHPKKETNNDDKLNASYAAAQLLKFCCELKEGDLVIVPGKSNEKVIAIGIVDGKVYEEKDSNLLQNCPFVKRIKISWIKQYNRKQLNPQLQLLFNSRHIVSSANNYSQFIDSTTGNFYRKGKMTFLVLNVQTKKEIAVTDFLFVGDLLSLVKEYSDENSLGIDVDEINMKVCVQSPGDIIMYALSPAGISILGLLILLLNGGKFSIEKWGLDISTKGIIQHISEFLDKRKDRQRQKALIKKIETLKIENPEDLCKILVEMKNPREKY